MNTLKRLKLHSFEIIIHSLVNQTKVAADSSWMTASTHLQSDHRSALIIAVTGSMSLSHLLREYTRTHTHFQRLRCPVTFCPGQPERGGVQNKRRGRGGSTSLTFATDEQILGTAHAAAATLICF